MLRPVIHRCPEIEHRESALRPTGLDRISPRFSGLPPTLWVRRIPGGLPDLASDPAAGCAGYERAGRSEHPVRTRHDRLRLQMQRILPRAPMGHELVDWPSFRLSVLRHASEPTIRPGRLPATESSRRANPTTSSALARTPLLQLARHLGDSGWSLYSRFDAAGTFDCRHEGLANHSRLRSERPAGPLFGETRAFGHQASPMINGRMGLYWQPAPASGTRFSSATSTRCSGT